MKPFPVGPYYAYHILANFQQGVKLPSVLHPVLSRYDSLNLTGAQLTPPLLDALAAVIRQGNLHNLYISPFDPKAVNGDADFHCLASQWIQRRYTHGCGALIYSHDRSTVFCSRLDQYTLDRPVHLRAGQELLVQDPVVFESNSAMAEAVQNFILTGSVDGSGERPPVPSKTRRGVDPNLLFWIENTLGFVPQSPDDLKKVNGLLANFYVPGHPEFPDWLAPAPGDWSLLGDLPNLQVLFMPEISLDSWDFLPRCSKLQRVGLDKTNLSDPALLANMTQVTYLDLPPFECTDYAFLERLPAVEILDLSNTSFRDCTVLTRMPELKLVRLPAERQLLHLELLDPLPMQVKTDPRKVRGAEIAPFELIPARPAEPVDLTPPYKVLHIETGGKTYEGAEITEKVVKKLLKSVKSGKVEMVYASLEPWGEDEFLEVDIAEGWASLNYSDSEAVYEYAIYNPDHAGDYEDAPPEIGGQSPVPKQHAIQDLSLTADCLGYFIKTGSPYPGAYWAKFYR